MTRQRYVLLVDINPALSILGQPPAATLGEAYSFMFQYFGGTAPYTCTVVGSVPSGWSFNPATGVLSHPGPSTPGALSLTLKLRDADYRETAPTTYTWSVVALPLQIAGDAPAGTQGTAYTTTYTATGGVAPRTFAVVSGTLPPGLSLDGSTGVLAGTPTTAGAYSWTVRVADSASATEDLADSAAIAYPTLALSGSYAGGTLASPYSSDLTISGGDGSYSNARVTSGSLPAGLSLSIVGSALRLSGTPTAVASSTFTVAVDSGDGQTVSKAQTLQVQPPIVPWDSATKGANITLANGNTSATKTTSNAHSAVAATLSKSSGKWYFEVRVDASISTDGIIIGAEKLAPGSTFVGAASYGFGYYQTGQKINASTPYTFGASYGAGDVIGVAIDATAQKIWYAKNGTWQGSGNPSAGTGEAFSTAAAPSIFPAASVFYGSGDSVTIRTRAAEFSYSPPSGFTEWADP